MSVYTYKNYKDFDECFKFQFSIFICLCFPLLRNNLRKRTPPPEAGRSLERPRAVAGGGEFEPKSADFVNKVKNKTKSCEVLEVLFLLQKFLHDVNHNPTVLEF